MSPEQAVGAELTPASDVFSLGSVLFFAVTGRGPFGSGGAASVLYRVVHDEPGLTAAPPGLRPVLSACLRKDPADRATLDELLDLVDGRAAGVAPTEAGEHQQPGTRTRSRGESPMEAAVPPTAPETVGSTPVEQRSSLPLLIAFVIWAVGGMAGLVALASGKVGAYLILPAGLWRAIATAQAQELRARLGPARVARQLRDRKRGPAGP